MTHLHGCESCQCLLEFTGDYIRANPRVQVSYKLARGLSTKNGFTDRNWYINLGTSGVDSLACDIPFLREALLLILKLIRSFLPNILPLFTLHVLSAITDKTSQQDATLR